MLLSLIAATEEYPEDPYAWNTSTVVHILERREYTGCTVLSHNTYSYCRNTVISASDKDGMDAIWILDTNGLSHAPLLLQDEQGTWWYYYWCADLDSSSSDSLQGVFSFGSSASVSTSSIGNNLKVFWDPLNLKITRYEDADIKTIQDAINAQYPKDNKCTYSKGIYFEGDFSKSWEAANNRSINQSNMLYSALIENCAQTSLDILGQSIDSFSFMIMHYKMRKLMLPRAIHPLLASFGKEF